MKKLSQIHGIADGCYFEKMPAELLSLIILFSDGLSRFTLQFVSDCFRAMVIDNPRNRLLRTSFATAIIPKKKKMICKLAAQTNCDMLKWARSISCP